MDHIYMQKSISTPAELLHSLQLVKQLLARPAVRQVGECIHGPVAFMLFGRSPPTPGAKPLATST